MLKLTVPPDTQPLPLRDFLRRQVGLSLSSWRKLKSSGTLRVNNVPVSPGGMVAPGDMIEAGWAEECTILPVEMPLEICYQDDYLLIINKPAGLLVHPTVKENLHTLANGVISYYRQHNLPFGFHPIHRLDRNTSGLIAVAKIAHIQHVLSGAGSQKLTRIYTAVASGNLPDATGTITAPIARAPGSIIQRMVAATGQPAATRYRKLSDYENASLVELELLTGRTHQIRVHLAHIGHPLLGDDLYGGPLDFIARQALHASCLSFEHPITREKLTCHAPLPADIRLALTQLQHK